MIDPTTDLQTGSVTALGTAMTTAGYTARVYKAPGPDVELPYVEVKDATITPRNNKTHDGTNATQLFIAWAKTADVAQTLAALVLSTLTDRNTAISVANTTKLITYDLDSMGPLIPVPTAENDSEYAYGVPVRLRYRTHE